MFTNNRYSMHNNARQALGKPLGEAIINKWSHKCVTNHRQNGDVAGDYSEAPHNNCKASVEARH